MEKAIEYAKLRKPYIVNNLEVQYDIQDRRRVYQILQEAGIEIPRYAILDREDPTSKFKSFSQFDVYIKFILLWYSKMKSQKKTLIGNFVDFPTYPPSDASLQPLLWLF